MGRYLVKSTRLPRTTLDDKKARSKMSFRCAKAAQASPDYLATFLARSRSRGRCANGPKDAGGREN